MPEGGGCITLLFRIWTLPVGLHTQVYLSHLDVLLLGIGWAGYKLHHNVQHSWSIPACDEWMPLCTSQPRKWPGAGKSSWSVGRVRGGWTRKEWWVMLTGAGRQHVLRLGRGISIASNTTNILFPFHSICPPGSTREGGRKIQLGCEWGGLCSYSFILKHFKSWSPPCFHNYWAFKKSWHTHNKAVPPVIYCVPFIIIYQYNCLLHGTI